MAAAPAGRPKGAPVPGAAAAQVVVRVPVPVVAVIENVQSVVAATSMYWLSQNRLPVDWEHLVVQPPVSMVTQASSQEMFA